MRSPLLDRYLARLAADHPSYTFGFDTGASYLRVWKRLGNQSTRSAVAFIGPDGSLYRADSWQKRGRKLGDIRDVVEAERDPAMRPRVFRKGDRVIARDGAPFRRVGVVISVARLDWSARGHVYYVRAPKVLHMVHAEDLRLSP